MPGFPDLESPLVAGAVTIRVASERDIPEVLIAYQDDPELHLRLGEQRPPSGAELGRRSERAGADRAAGRGLTFTIVASGSDVCRGQIHVQDVDWDNARAELAIWVAPADRGKGLAREALAMIAEWLLRRCRLERVQIFSEAGNEPMIRAARAAGFTEEGVLRLYTRGQRARVDNVVFSMVRRDLRG